MGCYECVVGVLFLFFFIFFHFFFSLLTFLVKAKTIPNGYVISSRRFIHKVNTENKMYICATQCGMVSSSPGCNKNRLKMEFFFPTIYDALCE